jgi:hypothetical protein
VMSGIQLFLVYNLVVTPEIETPTYDFCTEGDTKLISIASAWKNTKVHLIHLGTN